MQRGLFLVTLKMIGTAENSLTLSQMILDMHSLKGFQLAMEPLQFLVRDTILTF